ncbi:hypothetical protein [Oceanivirga salmonicida]|uniref:hypothetical protein n=1 Tax=Oceanivirga salmonicida TaxID=1769291 RepID=UPI0008346259|nr:hypothetical protein [Oceanivirga salmonicida]
MFFGFFGKNKNEKIEEVKEYLNIIDEDGKEITVEKKEWLATEFYPYIENNINNDEEIYNMVNLAMEYGVKYEVLEPSYKLYIKDKSVNKNVCLLFKAYRINKMNDEAVDLYEEYMNDGNDLNCFMYYDLALAQEELSRYDMVEKNLFLAFTKNNNYIKVIDKLMDYTSKFLEPDKYYEWLKDLNDTSSSWYLSKELAILQFEKKLYGEATNNLLKSLSLCSNNEKNVIIIAKLLLENNRLNEFENCILPKYDINTSDINFHNIVQKFYFKDKQYKKGLDLLKEIYLTGKYDEIFVQNEKLFLKSKLLEQDKKKYARLVSGIASPKARFNPLFAPIYTKQLNMKVKEKTGPKFIFLGFTTNGEVGEYSENLKGIVKNISSYICDLLYFNSDISINNAFLYDDLGPVLKRGEYKDEYFKKIKESNPDMEYVITGEIFEVDSNGAFDIRFYTYNFEMDQRLQLYLTTTSENGLYEVISKFLNVIINKMLDINVESVKITDKKFLEIYTDYVEIFLNVNNDNENKVYTTDKIIRYCLNNPSEYKVNIALSTILTQSEYFPEIKENYKQKIYDIITLNNMTYKDLMSNFEFVYGEINEEA